jgi:hypothetical protein
MKLDPSKDPVLIKHVSTARMVAARMAATFLIGLAVYWIVVFTQTDFRPQWRALYLFIAAAFLLVGGGIWLKHRWAHLASLVISALALAFTCLMLVGAPSNPALWGQALILIAYTVVVGPLAFPRTGR